MAGENLKSKVVNGLFWKLLEQSGYQGVQVLVGILLARLLTKEEVGTVSMIGIFITIANTFVQSGFATALVQRRKVSEEDYDSVFWISMLLSLGCFLLLFLLSPLVAGYYRVKELCPMLRAMALVLFPGGVISIQTAWISRNLQFRALFRATMGAVLLSGAASVSMAFLGFGAWSMAWQQLIYYFSLMLFLFWDLPWRPRALFRLRSVEKLFSFGWKILVSGLIDTVWQNVYGLVIGRKYSLSELGVYNRGEMFPKLICATLSSSVQSVMLPAYAKLQSDRERLRDAARRSIRLSAFLLFPMMAGMMAVSRPLILFLLTEKWISVVPYLCIFCFYYAIYPMHSINLQLLNAAGRSDLFLKLELLKKGIGILVLIGSLPFGILPMLLLKAGVEYLDLLINAWPNQRLIGYGPLPQCVDMLPSALCSLLMALPVRLLENAGLAILPTLLLQCIVGLLLYLLISWFFNRELLLYLIALLKERIAPGSGQNPASSDP